MMGDRPDDFLAEAMRRNRERIEAAYREKVNEALAGTHSLMFDTDGTIFSVAEFAESVGWTTSKVYSKLRGPSGWLARGMWAKVARGRYRWSDEYVATALTEWLATLD